MSETGRTQIRLTRKTLSELRMALLGEYAWLSVELDLVEERYPNDDVVVRIGRPDRPERGERILDAYNTGTATEQHQLELEAT